MALLLHGYQDSVLWRTMFGMPRVRGPQAAPWEDRDVMQTDDLRLDGGKRT